MERCKHQYRPSLRGGYMCELCEKDIDSETYDEIAQLTAERDRLKSALTRLRHSWPTEDQTAWAYAGEVSDIAEEALKEAK